MCSTKCTTISKALSLHILMQTTYWICYFCPYLECPNHDIEMIQNKAVCFIFNLRKRESVTKARKEFRLDSLVNKRKKIRRNNLLLKLLSNREDHSLLVNNYYELFSDSQSWQYTEKCPGVSHGPPTIYIMPRFQSTTTIAFFLKIKV